MKRFISILLLVGMIIFSAGCANSRSSTTTAIRPTTNATTKQATVATTKQPTVAPTEKTTASTTKPTTAAPTKQTTIQPNPAVGLKLKNYVGGFFSVQLPEGWQISTVGQYVTFGFRAWDPKNPDYQIFYYGKCEPFLKSNATKQYYKDNAASLSANTTYKMYAAAPALDPMTVESLLYRFNDWATFANSFGIVHQFTNFQNLKVSARIPYSTYFAPYATDEGLVMATFKSEKGSNCVAKFGASIISAGSYPLTATIDTFPLAVYNISGVMAPQETFNDVEQILTQAAFSLRFTQAYTNAAVALTQAGTADALYANAVVQYVFDVANAAWDIYIRR
jgi:hypothetical protein